MRGWAFCLLLICVGCAATPEPGLQPNGDLEFPIHARELMLERDRVIRTAMSQVSVKVEGFEREGRFKGVLLLERPGRVRLWLGKTLTPSFFDLLLDNGNFQLYLPSENRVIQGAVGALLGSENLTAQHRDMILLLHAVFTPMAELSSEVPGRYVDHPGYDLVRTFVLEPGSSRLQRADVDVGSREVGEIRYGAYRSPSGIEIPSHYELIGNAEAFCLTISCSGLRLNEPHTSTAFRLSIPDGVDVVDVN